MTFTGEQKTFHYVQTNLGSREAVFPLLCPVREADWIDGWEYNMIYSKSGLAEQDCVFTTPHHSNIKTFWQITQYDKVLFAIEFVRVTPNENIVKINIQLEPITIDTTRSIISYQYTGLNEEQNKLIETSLEASFKDSMSYWENAINHYLKTGEKLIK